jgi:hypothetical protein
MRRFNDQVRHCYRHGAQPSDHWRMLLTLAEPLAEGANIRSTRTFMFALVPPKVPILFRRQLV